MSNSPVSPAAQQPGNPLKQALLAGRSVIGAVLCTNNVEIASHVASLGFDFLWIEMEHAPITLEGLRNIVLATRGLKAVPVARPPVNELWTAKRVLDAGALGVIFPFTSTPALARQAVDACRYPPAGRRGSGATLAQLRWPSSEGYYDFADRNVMVIAMIEEACAVENIDQIAATPGLDVLFVGPSDLSFSMGLRGAQVHPRQQEAIQGVLAAGKRHGKVVGRPALTAGELREYEDQGFRFFMTGTELELLSAGARELLGERFSNPLKLVR